MLPYPFGNRPSNCFRKMSARRGWLRCPIVTIPSFRQADLATSPNETTLMPGNRSTTSGRIVNPHSSSSRLGVRFFPISSHGCSGNTFHMSEGVANVSIMDLHFTVATSRPDFLPRQSEREAYTSLIVRGGFNPPR